MTTHAAASSPVSAEPARRASFTTSTGMQVLLERSEALPMVDVNVTLRTGAVEDPAGLEGLTRLTARMIRMGTPRLTSSEVDEAIDAMGAQLDVEVAPGHVRFHGLVLERNLEPFFELLSSLLSEPAFRRADLAHLQRETLADLVDACDNDRLLCMRHFRRHLFGTHPYGRTIVGTTGSIRAVTRAHVVQHYASHYLSGNTIVGVAGPVDEARLRDLVGRHLRWIPVGDNPARKLRTPRLSKGRRLLVVDKPERAQTQVAIGTLGVRAGSPDYVPLIVANAAFGGMFSSRLMQEVRVKRGWSYGAGSGLGHARQREAWTMSASPAAKDAAACIALQMKLMERWVDKGLRAKELRFAQDYLAKSHAFELDTAIKRLDHRIDVTLLGLPRDFHETFDRRVRQVTLQQANDALRRRLSARDLSIVVVATAEEQRAALSELPGVSRVETTPYDAL